MNLKCGKCQTDFVVPPEVLRSPEPRAECPTCGARYRLKPRTGLLPSQVVAAGDLNLRSTPSMPLPGTPSSPGPAIASPSTVPERPTTPLPSFERPANDAESATVVSTGGITAGRLRLGGSVFAAGDVVAQRYRIVRFLAQGGMGEVYEAEDIELRQEVALKTVSAHIGGDPAAIDRFKREIALARRVTHPNVCRIFDLGQHLLPPFPDGQTLPPLTFLTMELLRGETLSQLLRRRGRLSVDEALPLIEQMGAALDAAHGAMIVHRDFKSENVFLVDDAKTGGKRVVVTDFGVARGADSQDRFAAQVTGMGIVGTPAYMAPEQVENKEITSAADLYALGIVIYEMVTGKLPFESPNPLTTAVKRLKEAPAPPHVLVPDLPAYWEKAILRCLERSPADRFANAAELVEALRKKARPARPPETRPVELRPTETRPTSPLALPPPPTRPPPAPLARSTKLALVLLLVAVLSAGLAGYNYLKDKNKGSVTLRRAVAVFGLKNLAQREDTAWISTAVAEMLSTEVARGESLRSISGQDITEARRELTIKDLAAPDRGELEKVRGRLGCDYVVAGSYLALAGGAGDQVRIDLQLLDTASGAKIGSYSEDGNLGELIAIVGKLGDNLLQGLGSKAAAEDAEAGQPRDPEAGRLYAEALDALRAAQPLEARDLLEKAIKAEADNPLIHSALSSAWSALGYAGKAAEEARRAFELASRLPREDQLLIEGRLREAEGNAAAARDIYRSLFEAFPDNLDYGLSLVAAERSAGSAKAALETVEALKKMPQPLADDIRIDLAEADAAAQIALFDRQRLAAERAVGKARAQGARLQLARALLQSAQAQRVLGHADLAVAAAREAVAIFEQLGHRVGRAQATNLLGGCLLAAGKTAEATAATEAAAALYREVGDQGGLAASLNNLAMATKRQGDLDRVAALYGETEQIYRQTGDRRGLALAMNNRAVLLVERDQLAAARQLFESSRPAWEEMLGKLGSALSIFNIAQVARLQGNLEESRQLHQQALDIRQAAGAKPELATSLAYSAGLLLEAGQPATAEKLLLDARKVADEVGEKSLLATVLSQQGELALLRRDFTAARSDFEHALDIRREGQDALLVPGCLLALARLSLAEGVPVEASQLAREALAANAASGRPAEAARAAALLALALLADGDPSEARGVLADHSAFVATTEQAFVRLSFGLAEATLLADRDAAAALPRLAELAAEARRQLYLPLALEIELAWAKAAARAGRAGDAQEKRRSAAAEAKALGLTLLAAQHAAS